MKKRKLISKNILSILLIIPITLVFFFVINNTTLVINTIENLSSNKLKNCNNKFIKYKNNHNLYTLYFYDFKKKDNIWYFYDCDNKLLKILNLNESSPTYKKI